MLCPQRAEVKCRFADVRIFEVVKCREMLRILSANVMGKMRMWQCRYAANERMPVAYLYCTFSLNINTRLTCANKLFTYLLTYCWCVVMGRPN